MNIKEYFTKKENAFINRKDKNFLITALYGFPTYGGNRYCTS